VHLELRGDAHAGVASRTFDGRRAHACVPADLRATELAPLLRHGVLDQHVDDQTFTWAPTPPTFASTSPFAPTFTGTVAAFTFWTSNPVSKLESGLVLAQADVPTPFSRPAGPDRVRSP